MTGLRISDVQKLKRSNFMDNYVSFVAKKSKKDQSIAMNLKTREIVNHEPLLFEKKFADQHINDEWRKIMKIFKNSKKSYLSRSTPHFCNQFFKSRRSS